MQPRRKGGAGDLAQAAKPRGRQKTKRDETHNRERLGKEEQRVGQKGKKRNGREGKMVTRRNAARGA